MLQDLKLYFGFLCLELSDMKAYAEESMNGYRGLGCRGSSQRPFFARCKGFESRACRAGFRTLWRVGFGFF